MSKIALVINSLGANSAKCTALLMKSFGVSLGSTQESISKGRPVLERELFDRKDPAFPEKLLTALKELERLGCSCTAFELLDGQTYVPKERYYTVTPDRLSNIVAAHEASLAEQRRLGESEIGEQ